MSIPRRLTPSLQELHAFEAVGRHGSFSNAGKELALTQSAVSKQIRHLENKLGIALFSRSGTRVALTQAGATYLEATQEMLVKFRTATHTVVSSSTSTAGLNVVVLPTFASQWLIPRLPIFNEQFPQITVNLTTRVEPFEYFGDTFDAAIAYGAPNWSHANVERLCDEVLVAVASPAYQAREALYQPLDLSRATLLQQANRPGLWADWFAANKIAFARPYRGPVLDRFSMTVVACVAGLGVALVPHFLVEQELRNNTLVVLSDKVLLGAGAYYLVVPPSKRNGQAPAAFQHWVVQEAQLSQRLAMTYRTAAAAAAEPDRPPGR